jgi:hypothetical protein
MHREVENIKFYPCVNQKKNTLGDIEIIFNELEKPSAMELFLLRSRSIIALKILSFDGILEQGDG